MYGERCLNKMQRELLAEAATRQDHSSLQIRVVGGSPGTVSIQTAGRRKSLVGPSLCPGIMPGSPVGWWKGSSKLTLRHWWPVGAFLGFLKQLPAFSSEDIMCPAPHQ